MEKEFEYIPTENLNDLENLEDLTSDIKKRKEKLIDSTNIPKEYLNNKKEVEDTYLDDMARLKLIED